MRKAPLLPTFVLYFYIYIFMHLVLSNERLKKQMQPVNFPF